MSPPLRARYVRSTRSIVVPNARVTPLIEDSHSVVHALLEDLADVSLLSLARAVNARRLAAGSRYLWMYLYGVSAAAFEPTVSVREPFNFEFYGDHVRVRAESAITQNHPQSIPLREILDVFLRRSRASVARIDDYGYYGDSKRVFVSFDYRSLRNLRVTHARRLAHEVSNLTSAVATGGALNAATIEQLLIAGHADLLIGQHEHRGFDAKRVPYGVDTTRGQFALATDVAAFANGETPGLIVCGLVTRKIKDSDAVIGCTPIALADVRLRDWLNAIKRWVVPVPTGLSIDMYPRGSDTGYVLVRVPQQPDYLRPFLVRGGRRASGRIVETTITVPTRDGEHTTYADVAELHALLSSGRTVPRR